MFLMSQLHANLVREDAVILNPLFSAANLARQFLMVGFESCALVSLFLILPLFQVALRVCFTKAFPAVPDVELFASA